MRVDGSVGPLEVKTKVSRKKECNKRAHSVARAEHCKRIFGI